LLVTTIFLQQIPIFFCTLSLSHNKQFWIF